VRLAATPINAVAEAGDRPLMPAIVPSERTTSAWIAVNELTL
jgi:hypothetical protein